MKKLLRYSALMVLICLSISLYAQSGDGVGNTKGQNTTSKFWSKIDKDPNFVPTKLSAPTEDFIQPPQVIRKFNLGNELAIVYPNFRPWPSTVTQSEMSIDVHPLNEKIIFCSANTYAPSGTLYGQGIYFTLNQGTTWTGYDNPPYGTNSGDPASVIGINGYFYEGYINNSSGQSVARSTDNGATWTTSVVGNPASSSDLYDKNHMTVDKSPTSPYVNRVYVAYTDFASGSANENQVVVKYSTDMGLTWNGPVNISSALSAGSHNQGVNLSTGPNGEVYAVWAVYDNWGVGTYGEDAIGFAKSTDGGVTWGTPKRIYAAANFGIRGNLTSKQSIRVSSFPAMGVDRTNGSRKGYIYVVWPQITVAPAGSDPDIVTIRSTDGGTTWSTPIRVNDDPINNGKDQYYPWVTVDQTTGAVYHIFYDSRNVANTMAEVYIAKSTDGNLTFENIKVSDHSFTPAPISGLASGYQGDYIGIAANKNFVYPYWADNSSGLYQGWMAKLSFGPRLVHTPLTNTENLTGPYNVLVKVFSSNGIAANGAKLFWKRGAAATYDSLALTKVNDTTYTGSIPGNGATATYSYYVAVTDTLSSTTKLPSDAPATVYSFTAQTDVQAPVITHTVIGNQYRETWPVTLTSYVTDNIGIDSAWVVYKIKSTGTLRQFKLSNISDSLYSGVFNIDTTQIALNDTLYYRIVAKDASTAHNLGYHPGAATFNTFKFVADTVKPVIVHAPLTPQPITRWPSVIRATVTDNIGVLSVQVNYKINSAGTNRTFNLVKGSGNDWSGTFNVDTNQVHVGDSIFYYIKATDNTTSKNIAYAPATGFYAFPVVATNGTILVVNSEATLADRYSKEKPNVDADVKSTLGASANLIAYALLSDNYMVDLVPFASMNTANLNNYDVVILSAGTQTSTMFSDAAKRLAIVNYTLAGGKVLVEGGEVGYVYRKQTSEVDAIFRQVVLHDSTWSTDGPYNLRFEPTYKSTFFSNPNFVPDSAGFVTTGSYGRMDIMTLNTDPGIIRLSTSASTTYPSGAVMNGYQVPNTVGNPLRNVKIGFSLSSLTDTVNVARPLIKNLVYWLRNSVVPVELTAFTANVNENQVNLAWNTATELNNSGFEVERRTSGTGFAKVGYIPGRGTTTAPSTYSYIDKNLPAGTYVYRLKQMDFDGKVNYSSEVTVDIVPPKVFSLSQNYPNPFNPSTTIKYSIPTDGIATLAVFNLLGQKVAELVNGNVKAGTYEINFNASKLSSGIYFYQLEAGKFKAVKKMMLVK